MGNVLPNKPLQRSGHDKVHAPHRHLGIRVSGSAPQMRRVRAHGKFIEHVPLVLLVVAFVELSGAAHGIVVALAAGFVLSRLLHAAGMLYTSGPALRGADMLMQHASFLAGAVLIVKAASDVA